MSEAEIYDLRRGPGVSADLLDPAAATRDLVERARRAVGFGFYPAVGRDQAQAKEHIDLLLRRNDRIWNPDALARRILTTGSQLYRDVFNKMLVNGLHHGLPAGTGLNREEIHAVERAMATGTGGAGGFAVPFQLDSTIVPTSNSSINPHRSVCRVITTSTSEWRQAMSGGMAVAYSSEGLEGTDDSATLAQPALKPVRVMGFIPISRELTEDWGEFEAEHGQLINDAKDDLESTKFTLGTGINEPQGLVTGATTTVTAAGSGSFALADLYSLEAAIPARFRPRSVLFGNRAQWDRVRQFNVAGGSQVWVPRLTHDVGTGSNLDADVLGFGANEISAMTGTITTGSKILVVGDPRYFVIVDRVGMDIEIASHLFSGSAPLKPTGQRGLITYWRNTSGVLNPNAFRTLVTG